MKDCTSIRFDARLFEQGDVTLDVSVQQGYEFRGGLQLRGPSRFLDSQMTVSGPGLPAPVTVELTGCVSRGQVGGLQQCQFETDIKVPEISVSFPAFEVEGSRRELPSTRFLQQSVRGWCRIPVEDLMRQ
jgi:hypothetical protein